MLNTYRSRLVFYTILLTIFLVATLSYSYLYSRDVMLGQAETNISNTARLLNGSIEMEENELLHYAEVIRDDPRIQEYMFMVTKVGAEANALRQLFERNFGWLPVERFVFIDTNGRSQIDTSPNAKNSDLANAVQEHTRYSQNEIFYSQGSNGLELIAWAPISYQGTPLGAVAVTHILNSGWLSQYQTYSGGQLFIENNNVVQLSTLPKSEGKTFLPHSDSLVLDGEIYQVRPIALSGEGMSTPHLWYGISESEFLGQLKQHSRIIFMLAFLGGLAILIMGFMIARNFNRPLKQLIQITRAVTQGALPMMSKSIETNEIDTLSNRFSEMLQSLREKQEEVDRAHKRLEESAITDSLTGLHNRRYLKQIFPNLFAQAQREKHHLSGIMLDLDYFKRINDRYGHLAGDQCLIHLGDILKESCRASDYVFRMGGEEFLILSLSDTALGGELLAEKVRNALAKNPVQYKQALINMTTSAGVGSTDNEMDAEAALTSLLFHADKALYAAKSKGRNQVVVYSAMQDSSPLHNTAS